MGHAIDGSRARPEGRAREFRRRVRDGRVRRAILRDHPRTRPPSGSFPHETFWLEHDERDHEGPRGELILTAVAEDDVGTHVELASVAVSVAELISTHVDDASVAESNARFASDVGDWLTMTPVDGSGYLGSMECRATLRLVDRDYVSPEDAAERLRVAIEALHVAADEAFHPDEIRAAFATMTSALAIPTSRETRSARAFLDDTFRLPRDDPDDGGEKGLTPPRARGVEADDAGRGVRARAPGPRRRRRRRVRRAATRARASRRPRGRLRRRRGTFRVCAGRASRGMTWTRRTPTDTRPCTSPSWRTPRASSARYSARGRLHA